MVRFYNDGAAMEVGTGSNPPSCLAWVMDTYSMHDGRTENAAATAARHKG